jgi:adenosylcobinamide-GDP ribazoletransferase
MTTLLFARMIPLLAAVQFLTRLPCPYPRTVRPADVSASLRWFPLVGVLLGGILVMLDSALRMRLADPVANAMLVATLVVLSGGLHLDGLIDAADGLVVMGSAEQRLEAMHRSTAGTIGALAGVLALLGYFAAIAALPPDIRHVPLFLAPAAGRLTTVLSYYVFPYARPDDGISLWLKRGARPGSVLFGLAIVGGCALALGGGPGVALVGTCLLLALFAARLCLTRLPGLTGDVIGGLCELTQLAVLLLAPVVLR